jgi:sulfite reductase (NADPH) flavoprotein alpha-component
LQLQAENSPFTKDQADLLNRLLPTLTEIQRIWLSGYLSAVQVAAAPPAAGAVPLTAVLPAAHEAPASAPAAVPQEAVILFGSQTGNSARLAKELGRKLEGIGCKVEVSSMSDFKTNRLSKVSTLFIVVSTHGEGDPPDNAISFHEFVHSKRAPRLENLRYSVLALGDTSYEFFCKTGKDFDARLEELGAARICPRVDCDVDFEESAAAWMDAVVREMKAAVGAVPAAVQAGTPIGSAAAAAIGVGAGGGAVSAEAPVYSRSNPFEAEILENLNLNGRGSAKETRHVELSLAGSGLTYEPGDSLGIYPHNHPELVDALIGEMGWKPDEPVPMNKQGDICPLRQALQQNYEITVLTKTLVEQAAKLKPGSGLADLLAAGNEKLKAYLAERDLLDLVRDYSLSGVPAAEFVTLLRKIPPRLYSIASSPRAYPDEAHLTIRAVRYHAAGRDRYGVCSVQVAERLQPGDTVPVFIQHNDNFKLPADSDAPIMMIGPGTGVAPFRAFLQDREETGAAGKNWLFYGDQHFLTDFLYQIEWQRWIKDGLLTRMDVAFSRDTDRKIYVQHRMLEKSKDVYAWIQDGAYVYVCGDEKHMAHDVHAALTQILQQEGGMSQEEASAYLRTMMQEKRYQRDVY